MKIIIISGPTGSGKTKLSNLLCKKLKNVLIISTDNYYKTGFISNLLSKLIRSYFDKTISFNKNLINKDIKTIINKKRISHCYKYNFITKKRVKDIKDISKIEYLIIEGIFSLEILDCLNKKNYIVFNLKLSESECIKRVLKRDLNERGKSKAKILKDFYYAWNQYKIKEKQYNNKKNNFILKKEYEINKILKIISTINS